MKTIIVKTQKELDELPDSFNEFTRIAIKSEMDVGIQVYRTPKNSRIDLRDNSSAVLRDNSSAVLRDNSSAYLWSNSSAELRGNSSAYLWSNSSAYLWERATGHSHSCNTRIKAGDNATVYKHADPKSLETESTVNIIEREEIITPSFETWLERGWVVADGIRQRLVSKKSQGEVTIYKTQDFKGKEFFVAQKGDKFSHGETSAQAIKDLRYKISERDVSEFEGWKIDDTKTFEELIEAYHAITGACEAGIKMFCESKDLKEEMTVKEAIEITKGAYASDRFARFFKGSEA